MGTVAANTQSGTHKRLQGVQFVPGLIHNLLSVGQLLIKGYSVVFENNQCIISDNQEKNWMISISRSSNNMFPLDITKMENLVLAMRSQTVDELWHLRLGHLNYKSLTSMAHIKMVRGIPELKKKTQCEDCVMAK